MARLVVRWLVPVLVLAANTAAAQEPRGRVVGRLIDAESSIPIAGAVVSVEGSTISGVTTVDGRYVLFHVPAGRTTLRARAIGYSPKVVTDVIVNDGKVTTQDISLGRHAVQIHELTVNAKVEQGTVNAALDEQRTSTAIVNAVSSEQMKRSPDGDAAAVAQRISGATVENGNTLNMRGLGDRYTTAYQDGARIPSPEPERRTVPFDLFPTALIDEITTSKTFTPDQGGDFSGGSVNIRTKDFPGQRYASFSVSSGLNSAATGTRFGFAPATGRDWIALGSGPRTLPAIVAATDFSVALPASLSNALINSFRNVWSVRPRLGTPNEGFGISLAGSLPSGHNPATYLVSGSYAYSQEIHAGEQRAQAQPADVAGGAPTEVNRFDGVTTRNSALWGGIANFGLALGSTGKITLHNMYNRTMDNEGRRETGISEQLSYPLEVQRLRYVERSIHSDQLAWHQALGRKHVLDFSVTLSGVARKEPDRSEIVYENSTGTPTWLGFSSQAAVRTFGDLSEHSAEADASWRVGLGNTPTARFLQIGALYRATDRTAVNRSYSMTLLQPLSDADRALAPEQLFDGRFTGDATSAEMRITPLLAGGSYTATDRLAAGYAMLTVELGKAWEFIGGGRVEHSAVTVSSLSSAFEPSLARPRYTDLLPSIAATYRASENMNLRFSASQTLSRPEYRELSPILYREVIGGDNIRGNADLKRALIRNYDIRWEWYPSHAEVLSVAGFVKEFTDPVERVYLGTSDQRLITYINAKAAHNYGVELEARSALSGPLRTLTVFSNVTLMKSRITLDSASGSLTNPRRKMVGQAPYVLNAGVTWTHPHGGASATVLFNRVGERIVDAGEIPLPDVVERPRNMVDASILLPLFHALDMRLDAKNLLDARFLETQGPVVREGYRTGRVLSIGFNWR